MGHGFGKTVTTLTAIEQLKYDCFEIDKVLVVGPAKVLNTWVKEVQQFDHLKHLKVEIVTGTPKQREAILATDADVYVISRDSVKWIVEFYGKKWPFDVVVLDEASSFKNPSSQRFKALKSIRKHIKRIYLLSGTPIGNGYQDLYAQLFLLDQGKRLGKTKTSFLNRFFNPGRRNGHIVYEWNLKPGADQEIMHAIKDICVSMSAEDYLELPPVIFNTLEIDMDVKSRKLYNELKKEMIIEIGETEIVAASAGVLVNRLQQMANGAVYGTLDEGVTQVHDSKLEALEELVEGLNGESALIFYKYKHDRERIVQKLGKKYTVRSLETAKDEDDWNEGKIDILLGHPASVGYGINLQKNPRGKTIIWFGLTWSNEEYLQANARIHRQGVTDKVFIHHLVVKDSVDEDIMAALKNKGMTQDALLNSLKARLK